MYKKANCLAFLYIVPGVLVFHEHVKSDAGVATELSDDEARVVTTIPIPVDCFYVGVPVGAMFQQQLKSRDGVVSLFRATVRTRLVTTIFRGYERANYLAQKFWT